MTDQSATNLVRAAFGMMVARPRPLMDSLSLIASGDGAMTPTPEDVQESLDNLAPNDAMALEVAQKVRTWDHVDSASWTATSFPNTRERRDVIYQLLEIGGIVRDSLERLVTPYIAPGPIVITASEVTPWYTYDAAVEGFYWKAYASYLTGPKGWRDIADLDRSTFAIVANLTNPTQEAPYQAKGLVVGHVQSGKTANFTGVIARAADAGYRLVIVLTGTTNILRHQTQRRIDKELLGRELVGPDYELDPDWDAFASHGGLPSTFGAPDWIRLTGPRSDYALLGYGGPVLDFKRVDTSKPFYKPVNLAAASPRIMIVKKNASVLGKVARDLKPYIGALANVPVLVIDDESDQASLDTSKPSAAESRQRTAVNRAILKLLELLPRSQYIGYTATPFANVFVNPNDDIDLFPRDFILPLDRPKGYMGASEFHDLEGRPVAGTSNEDDLVRSIRGNDDLPENLERAIDSFVLTGGVKLYREGSAGWPDRFPHHTMLVHATQRVDEHSLMKASIQKAVDQAGYRSLDGLQRLRRLWEEDFRGVTTRRANPGSQPDTFEELIPFIGECVDRVFSDGTGVLLVNGQNEGDTPDFDRDSVWKILVGGNKLSRGYTIEGLTVSYYRRRADAADTLMQMGRWFGYRIGYDDLVRLFIGREEPKPNGEVVDLYMAFEGTCRDEMAFREELGRFKGLPGEERILPIQVPPLVQAHLLRPTAPNKMYNAELLATNLGGTYREPTVAPAEATAIERNIRAARDLLVDTPLAGMKLGFDGEPSTNTFVATVQPDRLIAFLRTYRWLPKKAPVQRDIDYLVGDQMDPQVDSWLIIMPQLAKADPKHLISLNENVLTVKHRSRESTGGRYAVYSEPDHVKIAKYLAGHDVAISPNSDVDRLAKTRQGVMLMYPVQSYEVETLVTIGFGLAYPPTTEPKRLIWGVRPPAGDVKTE